MKVSTVEEMRQLDQRAIREFGIPDQILMENAGLAAFSVIRQQLGVEGKRFAVVCGLGNNGGDGLVVARALHAAGADVRVFVVGDPQRYQGPSGDNFEMVERAGIEVLPEASAEDMRDELATCDAAVDGLLGTGLTREVDGRYAEIIEAINLFADAVVSLDIPSGVDGNTGQVRGIAVRADMTVTFGLPKRGNLLYPGADLGGRLYVTHISFPPQLQETAEIAVAVNDPPPLPRRQVDGHKGSFGDVLFIAGAASYYGAPSLAALSLLRAGGGYSRLAAPRSVVPHLATLASEVVFAPQDETAAGNLAASCAAPLLELAGGVDFVVLGPGLSVAEETQQLVRRLAAEIPCPLLIDGDGLSAVAANLEVVRRRSQPTILTPHPGEMARLRGVATGDIVADPVGSVQALAADLGALVVLKGAHSLIASPDKSVVINTSGNSGMATAGSGDVLTGSIAAAYGLGLPVAEAVCTGVFVHGLAGDMAAETLGADGMTARDVLEHLPAAVKLYRDDYDELMADFYGTIEVV